MATSVEARKDVDPGTAVVVLGLIVAAVVWLRRRPTAQAPHYSMRIEWSPEDRLFVVSLPEWGPYALTHGATYEEAARAGREVLEMLIENRAADKRPLPDLPTPQAYQAA